MFNSSSRKRKRRTTKMESLENVLINTAEFITGRLYFVSLNRNINPKSTPSVHYFSTDAEFIYDSFYLDFGPLNLSMLSHYCNILKRKLDNNPHFNNRKIVHYTCHNEKKRVNAAFLIGAFSIIYLNYTPEEAYNTLINDSVKDYLEFRDASMLEPYTLSLLDCLKAIKKALTYGFFNFDNFDFVEYEHYERVENGDFNWILPGKFIAFCGPHNCTKFEKGYPLHSPESYFPYFRRHKVTTIIRLNKRVYDSSRFQTAGFEHKDLYFVDGGTPSDRILNQFLLITESAKGAVAVHCKAGLGRTGSLIACYIMKHYKFTAEEAIAWIRICRPGSIIGHQQSWLQEKQKPMWDAGEHYRKRAGLNGPIKHTTPIYSISGDVNRNGNNDNVTGIVQKVDSMEINDPEDNFNSEENNITQGDKLNEIKAQRNRTKLLGSNLLDHKNIRTKVNINNTSVPPTILRGGKIITSTIRTAGSTSTARVYSKRVESRDCEASRRCSQRSKVTAVLTTTPTCEKLQNATLKRSVRKKEPPPSWLTKNNIQYQNGSSLSASDDKTIVKRGKRTLALEKDKASPRSVKVLRRSHGQVKDNEKSESKLRLPSVKINKTL